MLTKEEKREAVQLLMDMVSIPSESGSERNLSEFVASWMKQKGFHRTKVDKIGNVSGGTSASIPDLLYCGHLDTVPGTIRVRRVGRKIFGRGASDAKGPLAAMLYSANLLISRSRERRSGVALLAVVGEEAGSKGIRMALKAGIKQKYAVFGEPSGSNNIVIGYRGRLEVKVDFSAHSFHASKPWVGRSALQCAVDFAKSVEQRWGHSTSTEKFTTTSATVTGFVSGVAGNVAPPRASLTVDLRFPPGRTPDEILKEIDQLARQSAGTARTSIEVVEASCGTVIETSAPIVKAMRRAIFRATKAPAVCVRKTGSGDMNHAVMHNIQAVTYGPGSTADEHTEEESIDINDYLKSIEVLTFLPEELERVKTGKENIGQS